MATITDIPFRQIPRQSALFLNYLESSPSALDFYQASPTLQSIENTVRSRLNTFPFPRTEIASILQRQNRNYGCDDVTLQKITALEHPESVAILTGQQVGLFTGPLYTIYKALTAISLANALKKRGIPAVPIFWMDTEDHDLAEVTHHTVLESDSSLRIIDFKQIVFDQMPTGPVGPIRFPSKILEAVEEYLRTIPEGKGKSGVRAQLESACKPGYTFAQSFAELLFRTLPGSGLVLFDPHDPEAKRLASPVFQIALRSADVFRSALLGRSRELENVGYHAQVNVLENSTVLFLIENGERRALEQRGTAFALKGTTRTFSLDELLNLADQEPERFSPNVLLRPVVQDHLFPTAAYVGGSSELAYFAQIESLYRLYGRPMPVIWPRDSITLIDPDISQEMDGLGIGFQDCFQGRQFVLERAVRNSGFSKAPEILDALETRLKQVLADVKPELQEIEPPLADALETARRKILYNVQHLKSQLLRVDGTHISSISTAVDRVINNCYPNQNLQERELGIQHFFARYGPSVLDGVQSAINISSFAHHVVRL